jgi:hypothetical protein
MTEDRFASGKSVLLGSFKRIQSFDVNENILKAAIASLIKGRNSGAAPLPKGSSRHPVLMS